MDTLRIYVRKNVHGTWDVLMSGGRLANPVKLVKGLSESDALTRRDELRTMAQEVPEPAQAA